MTNKRKLSNRIHEMWQNDEFDLSPDDVFVLQWEDEVEVIDEAPPLTFETAPDVLTVDELAGILRVNSKTLYDAVNDRKIPAQRVGKTIRLLKSAVQDWLAERGKE